jgi:hypothetical protein
MNGSPSKWADEYSQATQAPVLSRSPSPSRVHAARGPHSKKGRSRRRTGGSGGGRARRRATQYGARIPLSGAAWPSSNDRSSEPHGEYQGVLRLRRAPGEPGYRRKAGKWATRHWRFNPGLKRASGLWHTQHRGLRGRLSRNPAGWPFADRSDRSARLWRNRRDMRSVLRIIRQFRDRRRAELPAADGGANQWH